MSRAAIDFLYNEARSKERKKLFLKNMSRKSNESEESSGPAAVSGYGVYPGCLLNDDLAANLTSDIALEGIEFWGNVYKNCSPAETINYTVNDHATLFYQGTTAFDFNSGFMISGVQSNREDLVQYISCAPLPLYKEGDPYYSAEATHIPLVMWENSEHKDVCQAFIEYLYQDDNYLFFLSAVPVSKTYEIWCFANTRREIPAPIPRKSNAVGIAHIAYSVPLFICSTDRSEMAST